ncbi:hypothetical protein L1887_48889 [Cichorium endivia]|nr:hypothetical protein L1887_48889 [Cichorium endivia]
MQGSRDEEKKCRQCSGRTGGSCMQLKARFRLNFAPESRKASKRMRSNSGSGLSIPLRPRRAPLGRHRATQLSLAPQLHRAESGEIPDLPSLLCPVRKRFQCCTSRARRHGNDSEQVSITLKRRGWAGSRSRLLNVHERFMPKVPPSISRTRSVVPAH